MTTFELFAAAATGVISLLLSLLIISLRQLLKRIDKLDNTLRSEQTTIATLNASFISHCEDAAKRDVAIAKHGDAIINHEVRLTKLEK